MNKLIRYIKTKGISQKEAADGIGVTEIWLSMVLRGKRRPGLKFARKVESWTKGRIKARDVLGL